MIQRELEAKSIHIDELEDAVHAIEETLVHAQLRLAIARWELDLAIEADLIAQDAYA